MQYLAWLCNTWLGYKIPGWAIHHQAWLYTTWLGCTPPGLVVHHLAWLYTTWLGYTPPGLVIHHLDWLYSNDLYRFSIFHNCKMISTDSAFSITVTIFLARMFISGVL
ncbi:hypothetical protein OTU49_011275 [Cherax quadricarinatus]|uniref:Uncharacterized protein n=1 Tax=Cherax quadricarinatus TaxID=27406 RepID=A0AAW0W6G7_CHEQU